MKLDKYLSDKKLSLTRMAKKVGARSVSTVKRHRDGMQPPNADMMRRYFEATDGEVTPNDFFDFVSSGDEAPRQAEG